MRLPRVTRPSCAPRGASWSSSRWSSVRSEVVPTHAPRWGCARWDLARPRTPRNRTHQVGIRRDLGRGADGAELATAKLERVLRAARAPRDRRAVRRIVAVTCTPEREDVTTCAWTSPRDVGRRAGRWRRAHVRHLPGGDAVAVDRDTRGVHSAPLSPANRLDEAELLGAEEVLPLNHVAELRAQLDRLHEVPRHPLQHVRERVPPLRRAEGAVEQAANRLTQLLAVNPRGARGEHDVVGALDDARHDERRDAEDEREGRVRRKRTARTEDASGEAHSERDHADERREPRARERLPAAPRLARGRRIHPRPRANDGAPPGGAGISPKPRLTPRARLLVHGTPPPDNRGRARTIPRPSG